MKAIVVSTAIVVLTMAVIRAWPDDTPWLLVIGAVGLWLAIGAYRALEDKRD